MVGSRSLSQNGVAMDKAKIEFEIQQLTDLQAICNQIKDFDSAKQNDEKLLEVLKSEYKLYSEETTTITSLVKGKLKQKGKGEKPVSKDSLLKKFESYCTLLDISLKKRNGEMIGYTEVSNKFSNKKSMLKKKLDEQ